MHAAATTAQLVDADPDRAPRDGVFTSTVALGEDGMTDEVELAVRGAGPELAVTLRDDGGRRVDGADVVVRLDHAATSATTTRRLATAARGHHEVALGDVGVRGEWQLRLQVGLGLFDVREAEVTTWVP